MSAPRLPLRSSPRITVREAGPSEDERLRAAFNRAAGRIEPDFVPRDAAAWRWRYRQNPAGRRCFLSEAEDGRIVAQHAGIPVRVRLAGQDATWTQVCDTYVEPEAAGGLGGATLYRQGGRLFEQRCRGAAANGDALLYGMPTRRAHRLGGRQLGDRVVRSQHQLVLDLARARRAPTADVRVELLSECPAAFDAAAAELDALFERSVRPGAATLVKDARYLRWRYLERPDVEYCLLLARCERSGAALGLAVGARGALAGPKWGLIADWIVPADESGRASAALLGRLQRLARARGIERLIAMQPELGPSFAWFQQAGFRVTPSPYYLVGRCLHGRLDSAWLSEQWDYQMGDFDLC